MSGDRLDLKKVAVRRRVNAQRIPIIYRVYLSGPMTGIPEWNFPAFRAAAAKLRAEGFSVFDPSQTKLPIEEGDPESPHPSAWKAYLRYDVATLARCETVCVLPGWRESRGAQLEVAIALALGMLVFDFHSRKPVQESILEEADRIVRADRQRDYGHPFEDFTRTGKLWKPILEPYGLEADIPAEAVGLCMIAVKISREINKPKRDNRVDIAGYAKTLDLIADRRKHE